jgi:hypothetical protein
MMRREPAPEEPMSRVRLRTGCEFSVVNVSNAGLLVEGAARLLPGTHVDVHVETRDGGVLVRSRVTRAYVARLEADLVRYRGALAFDRFVDTVAAGDAISSSPRPSADTQSVGKPLPIGEFTF